MKKLKKLNEDQRKLVTDNHNLIYSFCYHKKLNAEEYYSCLAEKLCMSAITFDPNRNIKFSTYVYVAFANCVKQYKRDHSKKEQFYNEMIRLDEDISSDGTENITYMDLLVDKFVDTPFNLYNRILDLSKDCEYTIERLKGKKIREIAEERGISIDSANQRIRREKCKIAKILEEEGYL